jgi:hypothetical protein
MKQKTHALFPACRIFSRNPFHGCHTYPLNPPKEIQKPTVPVQQAGPVQGHRLIGNMKRKKKHTSFMEPKLLMDGY